MLYTRIQHITGNYLRTVNDSCLVSLGTGQLVFDILGQTEIHGVKNVTNSLSEALVQLGKQDKDVRLGVQREIFGGRGGGWLMRRELVYGTLYFPYSIFYADIILCLWKNMFWFPTIFLNNGENNINLKIKCDNHGIFLKFTIKWSL